ncbi:MAG: Cytochrome P450 superfamily protein, partial [uncultured Solirubrobacteraceae bacterium]
ARDGVGDAVLDCDDTNPDHTQGTSDTAVLDATGVDPDPVRCEVVDRPSTGGGGGGGGGQTTPGGTTPAQTTGAQPPRTASLPTLTRAGVQLSCAPGAWSGAPTFAYAWFVLGAAGQPAKVADGQRYTLKDSDEGRLVFCAVLASNPGGIGVARSALLLAPTLVRMPELQGRTEAFSREKLLKITNGAIVLKTKRKGKADIDCALGGTRGSDSECATKAAKAARKKLDPGDVYITTPKDGRTLEADPASGDLPKVTLGIYDRSLDVSLPPVGTPKKFGDDCPLTGKGFTTEDRKAFIAGLQGKYESFARTTLDKRECRFKIRDDFNREQESDPYVGAIEVIEIEDRDGLRLTIERNRAPDLVVIPYHRRLKGTDNFAGANIAAGAEVNPGLGSDGDLTAMTGASANDVCFHVREASTGRPVQGVAVRALDPNGRVVEDRVSRAPFGRSTNEDGNACDMWPIAERGEYRFTFDWRGSNGVNEEGWLRIDAVDRAKETFTTISGRKLNCTAADRCIQVGTAGSTARAAVVVEAVILAAVVGVLVKGLIDSKGKGVDQAAAARASAQLADGEPGASLFKAAGDGGVTPGFLTLGGKLAPGDGVVAGGAGNVVSGGAGNLIGQDGAGVVSGGAGNLTSSQIRTVKPGPGGGLVALAGSGVVSGGGGNVVSGGAGNVVSGGAGNLIGQDGAGVVSGGAGNLVAKGDAVTQIGDRSVITSAGQLAPGTALAAGIGAGTPTSPIVSGGGGN